MKSESYEQMPLVADTHSLFFHPPERQVIYPSPSIHYGSPEQPSQVPTYSPRLIQTPCSGAEDWVFAPDPNNAGRWTTIPHSLHGTQQIASHPLDQSEWTFLPYTSENSAKVALYEFSPSYPRHQSSYHTSEITDDAATWTARSSAPTTSSNTSPNCGQQRRGHVKENPLRSPPLTSESSLSVPVLGITNFENNYAETSSSRSRPRQAQSSTKIDAAPLPQSMQYRCRFCSDQFTKRSNWMDHEKTHQSNRNRIQCPLCNKCYGRAADLARHNRSHHKLDTHSCRFCHKSFNRSDICRRHEVASCRKRRGEVAITKTRRSSIQRRR